MTVVKIGNRYFQRSDPTGRPTQPPAAPVYNEPSLPPAPPFHREMPPRKEDRTCRCSETDEYGRHCIGFCGPECEGRGEDRR